MAQIRRISYGPIRVFSGPIRPGSGSKWTKIELDELYPMDYLFFSQDPHYWRKTQNTYKTLKLSYNPFSIHSERGPKRTNDEPRRSNHDPENRKSRNS